MAGKNIPSKSALQYHNAHHAHLIMLGQLWSIIGCFPTWPTMVIGNPTINFWLGSGSVIFIRGGSFRGDSYRVPVGYLRAYVCVLCTDKQNNSFFLKYFYVMVAFFCSCSSNKVIDQFLFHKFFSPCVQMLSMCMSLGVSRPTKRIQEICVFWRLSNVLFAR